MVRVMAESYGDRSYGHPSAAVVQWNSVVTITLCSPAEVRYQGNLPIYPTHTARFSANL